MWPAPSTYHPFDAFREEEAVVQSAHGVIWEDLTLLLEQKVPSVQTIICPEDGKPPFLVSMNEGPEEQKYESLSPGGRTKGEGQTGGSSWGLWSPSNNLLHAPPLRELIPVQVRPGKRRHLPTPTTC